MTANSTKIKSKLTFLETVYPPISNQEAVFLQDDAEAVERLSKSDFYMIAGRAAATYQDLQFDDDEGLITFNFVIGDSFSDAVAINILQLPGVARPEVKAFTLEAGPKFIRIWDGEINGEGSRVIEWFTTEKLIWDRSRARPGIKGFDKYREAATYDLLYVGIAKVGHSFDRLIKNGHRARQEILSNEPQRYPGARVSDEIFLFLFTASPMIMTTYEPDHDFEDGDFEESYDGKRIIADAEKAFVSLLKPDYNVVRFANYPQGTDGLYGSDYVRYGYAINECFTFNTAHGRFRGDREPIAGFITNNADCIFVDGNAVHLYLSGVDYPAEPAGAPIKIVDSK